MKPQAPRSNNVGLTYASELFQDDLGSHLQRLYGVYVLARYLKINYIHSSISNFNDSEMNQKNSHDVEMANKIFEIPSDVVLPSVVRVCMTKETTFNFLSGVKQQAKHDSHFHLIKLGNPLPLIKEIPELWDFVEEAISFKKSHNNDFLKVAIHLNNADFFLMRVAEILKKHQIPFECSLLSDFPLSRLVADLEKVPSLQKSINTHPIAILKAIASADLFIMNASSISFVGGLINFKGSVVVPSFVQPQLSRWVKEDEEFEATIEDCCQMWKSARRFTPTKNLLFSPAHSTLPLKNLAITYDNTSLMDGSGSQLCRIYGIYALARELNIFYYHSPLQRIGYQGVLALEKNEENLELPKRYCQKFQIPSEIDIPSHAQTINLTLANQRALAYIKEEAERHPEKFFLVKIASAMSMVDRRPAMLEAARVLSPFKKQYSSVLRIAIHVRWGDLPIGYSKRLLPNQYYIAVVKKIVEILKKRNISYVCELHTELPESALTITPEHYGVEKRLQEETTLDPAFFKIKEFDEIPKLEKFLNEDPLITLEKLATSDILIMSRSAFSYLAAMFNQAGTAVYAPFEYPPMPGWLYPLPEQIFEEQLKEFCEKWKGKK
ncbi:MAG: hypothetical protein FJ390_01570 [Verrucomicrobia bacterium]|nr:hypothetical protein [Verrucomicrobiota bacterium]